MYEMLRRNIKRLVEICPQCCKSVDSSIYRLVQDACGHTKCRICLLQEVSGCLLCEVKSQSSGLDFDNKSRSLDLSRPSDDVERPVQQRKSVIVSLEEHSKNTTEQNVTETLDKDLGLIIKNSLAEDILFPKQIIKKNTGNFFHLKRVFSERFFNEEEDKCLKSGTSSVTETVDQVIAIDNKYEQQLSTCPSITSPTNEIDTVCDHKSKAKEFMCKNCDKSFLLRSKLKRHNFIHERNSKFRCNICDKIFKDNYALTSHMRTHTREKPFSCNLCGKCFSEINNLKRHEKHHTNERNYECNICLSKFLTQYDLKRHLTTHSIDKKFTCSLCDKQFKFKKYLTRHLATHKTHDNYLCNDCDCTFNRKDNLKRHIKSIHTKMDKSQQTGQT